MKAFLVPVILIILGIAIIAAGIAANSIWPLAIGIGILVSGVITLRETILKQHDTRGSTKASNQKLLDKINSGKMSQDRLKAIVLDAKFYTGKERSAALDKLKEQQALKDVVRSGCGLGAEAIRRIDDQEFLVDVVRTKAGGMDLEAVRRITDPDQLAEAGKSVLQSRSQELARVWLESMYQAAAHDPKMLLKVSGTAREIIRKAHSDGRTMVGGKHDDSWQRVPHMSSDCHDDQTPWTKAKGPWGEWGYHGDASVKGTIEHQDTNPLKIWESRFPGK